MKYFNALCFFALSFLVSSCGNRDISGSYIDERLNVYEFSKEGVFKGPTVLLGTEVTLPFTISEGLIKTESAGMQGAMVFKIMSDDTLLVSQSGTILTRFQNDWSGESKKGEALGFGDYRIGQRIDKQKMQLHGFEFDNYEAKLSGVNFKQDVYSRDSKSFEKYFKEKVSFIAVRDVDLDGVIDHIMLSFDGASYSNVRESMVKEFGACNERTQTKYLKSGCLFLLDGFSVRILESHNQPVFNIVFENQDLTRVYLDAMKKLEVK